MQVTSHRLGMGLGMAGITMMFIALTSAYVVRQGLDPNWRRVRMPDILLINTLVLLASSATLEKTRRARSAVNGWLGATILLGIAFVGGQLTAWRQLSAQGVYLSTNAHSSFFYLLTGLHGLHLTGGILALGYLASSVRRPNWERWSEATALYWHFMGALWVYLLILLFG